MRTKNHTAEMQLAERRGELIEKSLVERQAAYLLVALRQAILNIPQTWCRWLMGINDAAQVSRILREMAIAILARSRTFPPKSPTRIGSTRSSNRTRPRRNPSAPNRGELLCANVAGAFLSYNRHLAYRRNLARATFESGQQKALDRLKRRRLHNVVNDVLGKCSIHGQKGYPFGLWVIKRLRSSLVFRAQFGGVGLGDVE
jgi:hypothetical protein